MWRGIFSFVVFLYELANERKEQRDFKKDNFSVYRYLLFTFITSSLLLNIYGTRLFIKLTNHYLVLESKQDNLMHACLQDPELSTEHKKLTDEGLTTGVIVTNPAK